MAEAKQIYGAHMAKVTCIFSCNLSHWWELDFIIWLDQIIMQKEKGVLGVMHIDMSKDGEDSRNRGLCQPSHLC